MMKNPEIFIKKEDVLSGWKDISQYLGCDERTCRRWEEKLRVPIHRYEEAEKSRIFALKSELDEWQHKKLAIRSYRSSKIKYLSPSLIWRRKYSLALMILLISSITYLSIKYFVRDVEPADFSINKSILIIRNRVGKEIWSYDTKIDNLLQENVADQHSYRGHFQFRIRSGDGTIAWPYILMDDINRDGQKEILFSIQTQDDRNEGELICFKGKSPKKLWNYKTGRSLTYGTNMFPNEFRISSIISKDINHDGYSEIIVTSDQRYNFPSQLLVFDHLGSIIGEYWNTGRYTDFVLEDINMDGNLELLTSCINEEYREACIIVFDPMNICGGSPQIMKDYIYAEIPKGSEKYYIRLPRTDVDLIESKPVEAIRELEAYSNQRIAALTRFSSLYFIFDYALKIQEIRPTHTFIQNHANALQTGHIHDQLNNEYWENMKTKILYWDGKEKRWRYNLAMSNPWNIALSK